MFKNVVVGKPLVDAKKLLSKNEEDWEKNEKNETLFTETRFLPSIMKEAGVVSSTGIVKRNKPELIINLDKPDCLWVKWGKNFIYIVVGE